MQKRINELLNSRFMPGTETPEKMLEKIQEITDIVSLTGTFSRSFFYYQQTFNRSNHL